MPKMGVNAGMNTTEKDISFVTTDAEAVLTDETRHRSLSGADLHDPKAHKTSHQDGGADEMDLSGLVGAATKEPIFANGWQGSGSWSGVGDFSGGILDADGEYYRVTFVAPSDFSSITEAYILVIGTAAATGVNIDIESDYGAHGEDFSNHSESDSASTYDFTANKLAKIDLSGILSALAAGDRVGIKITMKQTYDDLLVICVVLKYS